MIPSFATGFCVEAQDRIVVVHETMNGNQLPPLTQLT